LYSLLCDPDPASYTKTVYQLLEINLYCNQTIPKCAKSATVEFQTDQRSSVLSKIEELSNEPTHVGTMETSYQCEGYRVETQIRKRPRSEKILVYGPGFGGTESINNPICSKSPTPFVGQHKKSKTYEKQKCVAVPQVVREEPLLWVAAKVPRPKIVHG
jgi:hypothetical protein